uniref:Uncharacterized protein n=1 Tax=Globodera rostochiensis TaxID=31243 RepID=A0A914HAR5_GLORO
MYPRNPIWLALDKKVGKMTIQSNWRANDRSTNGVLESSVMKPTTTTTADNIKSTDKRGNKKADGINKIDWDAVVARADENDAEPFPFIAVVPSLPLPPPIQLLLLLLFVVGYVRC